MIFDILDANSVDNMRCRNGQPFTTVQDKGSFWGNSTLKDVPFYVDGMYWGNSINVKKMKLSVRKLGMFIIILSFA